MKIIVVTTKNGPIFVNADHILRMTPVDCGLELDMVDSQVFEIRESLEHITRQIDQITEADRAALVKAMAPLENTDPPQPEPVAEGDAISRADALRVAVLSSTPGAYGSMINALPCVTCAQPEAGVDCDVVTAEEVDGAVVTFDLGEEVAGLTGSGEEEECLTFSRFCDGYDWATISGADGPIFFPMKVAVDILNSCIAHGEYVSVGNETCEPRNFNHRLAKPEVGPTLLEAAEAMLGYMNWPSMDAAERQAFENFNAAIESARGGER